MKILVDNADLKEIKKIYEVYPCLLYTSGFK